MARLRADKKTKEARAFRTWVNVRMAEHDETQSCLAAVLGISQQAVSQKLSGKSPFTLEDMAVICEHFGQQYQVGAQS